jgi:hypothetical protein
MTPNKKNGLLLIVFAMLLFSGCRSFEKYARTNFNPAETSPKIKATIHLPGLKNRVFEQDNFTIMTNTANIHVTQELNIGDTAFPDAYNIDINPTRFYELAKVISSVLPELQPDTNISPVGYYRFTILEYSEKSSMGLKSLAAFTIGMPCLLGMPANSVSTYVKIQTEWMSNAGEMISSTWSQGYNKTFIALYWGYGADARKRSNMLAMQEALRNSQH